MMSFLSSAEAILAIMRRFAVSLLSVVYITTITAQLLTTLDSSIASGLTLSTTFALLSTASATPTTTTSSPTSTPSTSTETVSADPAIFSLSADFAISSTPIVREHYWNISSYSGSPDGYTRQLSVVNGQYPGPLIEANEGDTIVVHVTNQLSDAQSIHWHGMLQNGSQWMDGVPGVSQCVISTGDTFTYNFTIQNQYGSYWWHSHYGNTLGDGLAGAMIVHSTNDPLVRGVDFDEERVLYLSDWMHDTTDYVVNAILTNGSYHGSPAPQGDAVLINGIGQQNCFDQTSSSCDLSNHAEIQVPVGQKIRFRVLNHGSHELMRLSIDDHTLSVVEVDDTPLETISDLHEVPTAPGQRTSIIIDTTQGVVGDAFWIRSSVGAGCVSNGKNQMGLAVLRYVDNFTTPTTDLPSTSAWNDLADPQGHCLDLDSTHVLTPLVAEEAPTDILQSVVLSSQIGVFLNTSGLPFPGWAFNNISYQNQINYPLLAQVEAGETLNASYIASGTFDGIGGGDIIVNNLDPARLTHPYHLHGRSFYLVGRGSGNITADDVSGLTLNTTNPLRRDTLQIPGQSWAILRLITDVPGVWPLHCHIGWHLAAGKMAAVVIQPDAIKDFYQPADWNGLCQGLDPNAWGPGRRDVTGSSALESRTLKRKMLKRLGAREA
ncbi:hypothetical protein P7C73_g475, partial [Tremellales sp. Uapishka_1]